MDSVGSKSSQSGHYLPGTIIAAVLSFSISLIVYHPLATFQFDFLFFDNVSVAQAVGFWSPVVKYISATLFSILTASAYYLVVRVWDLPFVVCLPLALVLGATGMGTLIIAIGALLAMLAVIALVFALFFGPGDR